MKHFHPSPAMSPLRPTLFLVAAALLGACDAGPGIDPASSSLTASPAAQSAAPHHVFCSDGEVNHRFLVAFTAENHLGEQFRVEGGIHVRLDIRNEGDGTFDVKGHANGAGLRVTALDGGQTYRAVGADRIRLIVEGDETVEDVASFRLISQGPGPNYNLDLTVAGWAASGAGGCDGVAIAVTGGNVVPR